MPYLDESVILGGANFPTVGVVDSLRAGTLMREQAEQSGALRVLAGTEVLGIDTAPTAGPCPGCGPCAPARGTSRRRSA